MRPVSHSPFGPLDGAPVASAPRLYVEALNDMFDAQSTRVYGLLNRVPSAVVLVMIVGAALALVHSRSQ